MHDFERFLHSFAPFLRVFIRNSKPLGGARSYPTELIRHLFYCTLIDRKINDLKLLEQKKFSNPKDSQRIENPAKTTPK
jgi:hypothetical protein